MSEKFFFGNGELLQRLQKACSHRHILLRFYGKRRCRKFCKGGAALLEKFSLTCGKSFHFPLMENFFLKAESPCTGIR